MKGKVEQLAARLESALGTGAVESSSRIPASYNVDGKIPSIFLTPHNPEQIGAALCLCAEVEAAVIPWGGGSAMGLGNIPHKADVVLALEHLNGLVEHDDANLTATAQSGMRLSALQKTLGERGQFLAIDPPHPGRCTIGGLVAANLNGPRRMLYGGVRDLVIGMKIVLAKGEQIKAGGKVVKNVAGYDMCKLFVGSLGTLGVITEVTFKMAPLPESAATLVASGTLAQQLELVRELSRSTLLPAAVSILSAEAVNVPDIAFGRPAVVLWTEGFNEAVTRHLREFQTLAERAGLASTILRDSSHVRLWEQVRDFGDGAEKVVYRLIVPMAALADVLAQIERWSVEQPARYIAHAGSGTIWISSNATPSSAAWFPKLIALAQEHRGHAVMIAAPPSIKNGIDIWGPPPPSLFIMREIKHRFDPQRILSPGRFIAGL